MTGVNAAAFEAWVTDRDGKALATRGRRRRGRGGARMRSEARSVRSRVGVGGAKGELRGE